MGNTNIVSRPSKDAAELSKEEMTEGTRELERKFAEYKPEAVCIVGKGIWEAVWRFRYGRNIRKEEFWDPAKPSSYAADKLPAKITWDEEFVGEVMRTVNACGVFLFFPFFWLCECSFFSFGGHVH